MKAGVSAVVAVALLAFAGATLAALGGQLKVIHSFYGEYAGGGSCKLRGGGALDALLCSLVAAVMFAVQRRWMLVVVALVVFVCLIRVDFLPIAFEQCSPLFQSDSR